MRTNFQVKYGKYNDEKTNFVEDVKSFVSAFNHAALKSKLEQNGGKLSFKLNGTAVELKYKEDFFLSASEMSQSH